MGSILASEDCIRSTHSLVGSPSDSLGLQNLAECHRIHEEIVENEIASMKGSAGLKSFRELGSLLSKMGLEKPWRKLVLAAFQNLADGVA